SATYQLKRLIPRPIGTTGSGVDAGGVTAVR
ncbi:unnamed protein product, partial [marine sediment metagenome]